MEVLNIIQNCINRELSDDVIHSKVSLYEGGVDSIELVKIIIEIEKVAAISLDKMLGELETITVGMLSQEISAIV